MGLLPNIVTKKVEARPREVMVNIIGNALAISNGNTDVDRMIQYWLKDIKLRRASHRCFTCHGCDFHWI